MILALITLISTASCEPRMRGDDPRVKEYRTKMRL